MRISQSARDYIHQFTNKTADDRLIIFKKLDEFDTQYARAKKETERQAILTDMKSYVKKNVADVVYVQDNPTVITTVERDIRDTKEIADIKVKLAVITGDKKALEVLVQQLNNEKKDLENQILSYEQQIQTLTAENKQLVDELDDAKRERDKSVEKYEKSKEKLRMVIGTLRILSRLDNGVEIAAELKKLDNIQNSELSVLKRTIHKIIGIYQNENQDLDDKLTEQQNENKDLVSELTEQQNANKDLVSELTEQQNANKDLVSELTEQQNANKDLVSELTEQQTKNKDLDGELTKLQDTNNRLISINQQLMTRIRTDKDTIRFLNSDLKEFKNIDPDKQIFGVPFINIMRGLYAALDEKNAEAQKIFSQFNNENIQRAAESAFGSDKVNEQAVNNFLNIILGQIENKARDEFNILLEQEKNVLESTIQEKDKEIRDIINENQQISKELSQLKEELQKQRQSNDEKQNLLSNQTNKLELKNNGHPEMISPDANDANDEDEDTNRREMTGNLMEYYKQHINELEEKISSLETTLISDRKMRQNLQDENQIIKDFIQQIKVDIGVGDEKEIMEKIRELHRASQALLDFYTILSKETGRTVDNQTSVVEAIKFLKNKDLIATGDYHTVMNDLQRKIEDLTRLNNTLRMENSTQRGKITHMESEIARLTEELNTNINQREEYHTRMILLEQQIHHLSQQVQQLGNDLDTCDAKNTEYRTELKNIKTNTKKLLDADERKYAYISCIKNISIFYKFLPDPDGFPKHFYSISNQPNEVGPKYFELFYQLKKYERLIDQSAVYLYDDRLVKLNEIITLLLPNLTTEYDKANIKEINDNKYSSNDTKEESDLFSENWISKFLDTLHDYIGFVKYYGQAALRESYNANLVDQIYSYIKNLRSSVSDDQSIRYINLARDYRDNTATVTRRTPGGTQGGNQPIIGGNVGGHTSVYMLLAICCAVVIYVIQYCAQKMKFITNIPIRPISNESIPRSIYCM